MTEWDGFVVDVMRASYRGRMGLRIADACARRAVMLYYGDLEEGGRRCKKCPGQPPLEDDSLRIHVVRRHGEDAAKDAAQLVDREVMG